MIDLNDVLTRVMQLGIDALADLATPVTAYGKPYLLHYQSQFPYFVTWVAPWTDGANSFEIREPVFNIRLRLLVGNLTEGVPGGVETAMYTYMTKVPDYINKRISLKTSTDTSDVTDLQYAQCLGGSGLSTFEQTGTSTVLLGTEFVVECHFIETISQSAF